MWAASLGLEPHKKEAASELGILEERGLQSIQGSMHGPLNKVPCLLSGVYRPEEHPSFITDTHI